MLFPTPKRIALAALLITGCILISSAQTSTNPKFKSTTYAGIEIGSKGVKMSIIEMGKNAIATGSFTTIKDTSVNTDFISFTPQTFTATVNSVTGLYKTAVNKYNMDPANVYTVVSSGVKGQAEKENKEQWIKNLADSFRLKINEPKTVVDVIDVTEEARLSHLGIVPESRRYNTFLIDIGSGNTKGGYFNNGNTKSIKLFQLTWGTKSIANAVEKRLEDDNSLANYKKQLARVMIGDPDKEITFAVNESGAYNMNDYFAFSGGISWSVATLMYPELTDNSVVPFTFNDLVKLNEKINNNYALLSADNIVALLDDKSLDKAAIAKEINRVHKVFDQKALMAGTALLINIVRQFEGTWEKKQFFLVKNGQVAWISAYVNQTVNH